MPFPGIVFVFNQHENCGKANSIGPLQVRDLTLVVVIIGVMTCPSPTGRGYGDDLFSGLMGIEFVI